MKLSKKYQSIGIRYCWHAATLVAIAIASGSFVPLVWTVLPLAGGLLSFISGILFMSGMFRILDAFEWFQKASDERALDARYSIRPRL